MERIKGCTHNTLVKITNEYMGSQWALFMPSVVYCPLQTLVNIILYAHGFMEKPLYTPEIHLLRGMV